MDKNVCEICGDAKSIRYYRWKGEDEYEGMILCNKHYIQLSKNNHLLDKIPSDHKKRHRWTNDEESLLEELYKNGKSIEEMSNVMKLSVNCIAQKASALKLGDKYMRTNNPKFKATYQDYDWCYDRYIVKGRTHEEMAIEAGCKKRTIQKWCSDIHGFNNRTFKKHKNLNDLQYQLILFGTLGDGHIDKRINQSLYIESHCEAEKEYLFWKYEIIKDLCHTEPIYHEAGYYNFGTDKEYLCQPFYRINTKIIDELSDIRDMPRIDKIKMLNEFGLSLHMLDDGNRNDSWAICLAGWSQEEIDCYIEVCKRKFNLECKQEKDNRYVRFTAVSSKKIDKIILNNIPNNIDIVKKKILENDSIRDLRHHRYIISEDKKIGLRKFCDVYHYSYLKCKDVFDSLNVEFIQKDEFVEKVKEYAIQ